MTDDVEYYSVNRAIESIQHADLVFLMIDATEGLVDQDKKIAGQAIKEGRGVVIVPSKWDLLKKARGLEAQVAERVRFQFPVLGFAPIAPVSSLTGYGIAALLATSLSVWTQLHRRVGTGRLNSAVESWVAHYPPPGRGRAQGPVRDAGGSNPVRFVIFVNRAKGFPEGYVSYLENCIRRDLGFHDVPISIEIRPEQARDSQ